MKDSDEENQKADEFHDNPHPDQNERIEHLKRELQEKYITFLDLSRRASNGGSADTTTNDETRISKRSGGEPNLWQDQSAIRVEQISQNNTTLDIIDTTTHTATYEKYSEDFLPEMIEAPDYEKEKMVLENKHFNEYFNRVLLDMNRLNKMSDAKRNKSVMRKTLFRRRSAMSMNSSIYENGFKHCLKSFPRQLCERIGFTGDDHYSGEFFFFAIIIPICVSVLYAIAILFPPAVRQRAPFFVWTDGALIKNEEGIYSICPRVSICSEGIIDIILISISRLTAFVLYTMMGHTFLSKMHCTIHYLSTSYLGKFVPFSKLHSVHKMMGRWFAALALLHTIGHFIRWIKRGEMGLIGTQVGISGIIGIVMMILTVWAMSGTQQRRVKDVGKAPLERFKSHAKSILERLRGAKWIETMFFEKRYNLHFIAMVALTLAMCAHTPRCAIITSFFVGSWLLDYIYGFLFKTYRLDLVEFSALPNEAGVQMLWANPKGFNGNSGEFVKVQLPWLENGGGQWHPFSIYLEEKTTEGLKDLHVRNDLERESHEIHPSSTALILIEFQNEFAHENGLLNKDVNEVMEQTNMLKKTSDLMYLARARGVHIFHVPYVWKSDLVNNPQRNVGVFKDIRMGQFFREGTWNADFVSTHQPQQQDIIIEGKNGLDSFLRTNLEEQLQKYGIRTLIIGGFQTNLSVESTMRTAYEKGFNVITLTDGTACKSGVEQFAATSKIFPQFSQALTCKKVEEIILCDETVKIDDLLDQNDLQGHGYSMNSEIANKDIDAPWQQRLDYFVVHAFQEEKQSITNRVIDDAREILRSRHLTTQVFMVPAGDWTKNVYKEVSDRKQLRSCWIKGPYVSPYSLSSNFSSLVLLATGIGITPALGVIGQYKGQSRFKTLIWSTRCPQLLRFFLPLLEDCHLVIIFYTGKEVLSDEEVLKFTSGNGNIFIRRARPASLTETVETVITLSESLMMGKKFSSIEKIPRKNRNDWCMFYCGGSKNICSMFKSFSKEKGVNFEYELFDW